jgi:uncharacterized membrane protein
MQAEAERGRISQRITSIDIVRGAVMVLMAIDHVRVYSGVPAGSPDPAVFFTRWITHFVAPAFVFFAGTAAFLHGGRLATRGDLARFLLTRGAWLVLLELTLIRVMWAFNFDFGTYLLAGVIWVLGVSMMLMAAIIYLPIRVIAAFGLLVIFGHNLLGYASLPESPLTTLLWSWAGGEVKLGGTTLVVLYSVIPWIGVMAAGYAFGAIMQLPVERRRRICVQIGLAAIALFIALRFLNVYGDQSWTEGDMHPVLRFLNTSKYPASLLFLLMTLGPAILAVGLLEGVRNRVTNVLATFGRVPLFYYLLHIPLIHVAALIVSLVRFGYVDPWLFGNHPMWPPEQPEGYRWSLSLMYLVTAIVVTILYFPSRWYARFKETHRHLTWPSYL